MNRRRQHEKLSMALASLKQVQENLNHTLQYARGYGSEEMATETLALEAAHLYQSIAARIKDLEQDPETLTKYRIREDPNEPGWYLPEVLLNGKWELFWDKEHRNRPGYNRVQLHLLYLAMHKSYPGAREVK